MNHLISNFLRANFQLIVLLALEMEVCHFMDQATSKTRNKVLTERPQEKQIHCDYYDKHCLTSRVENLH